MLSRRVFFLADIKNQIENMIKKAEKALSDAKKLLDAESHDSASGRAYYSVFHIMQAALLTKGLTYSKHSGVISGFSQHFIKTEIFPKSFAKSIEKLREDREIGDYSYSLHIDDEKASEDIRMASEILSAVKTYLNQWSSQSGLSIVATVMVMLILALFAAAAVSLITTAAGTGIQEERGTQAFYIADGGMQYTLKKNTYPDYDTAASSIPLGDGSGSFTVTVPTLSSGIDTSDPLGISLSLSTDGFTAAPDGSYWTLICGVTGTPRPTVRMTSDCEKINFTTKGSSSFSTTAPSNRGKDSTDAAAHPSNSVVMMYSWDTAKTTTLAQALVPGAKCTGASPKICVSSTSGFATSGFIRIYNATENNIEDVFYDGKGSGTGTCGGGCTACLGTNGCTRRAFDGNGNGTVNHISGTAIYQSEFSVLTTSTGIVPGSILTGNIKRVVQGSILSLKDP